MKSTGLRDKNDIIIKEGHTVGIPYVTPMGHIDDKPSYKAKIVFNYGTFWLDYEDCDHPVPQPILDWVDREKGDYIPNYGNPNIYHNSARRLEVLTPVK